MKKHKNFKRILRIAVLVMLLSAAAFSLNGCFPSETMGKSIDDFWHATVESDGGEKYVRIWGLTDKGIELSETQTEATIPETIGGYPVKYLKAAWFTNCGMYDDNHAARLGFLKRLTIEPCVRIGENFFGDNELDVIELKNEGKYMFYGNFGYQRDSVLLIPDGSDYDDAYTYYSGVFKKSEVINDCLIGNDVFYGYIGVNAEITIPENVTGIATSWNNNNWMKYPTRFIKYPIKSIKFPSSIDRISKDNIFSSFSVNYTVKNEADKNYAALTTVYVSSNTIIEDGAFMPDVIIERY
jgi:hypothetical protein